MEKTRLKPTIDNALSGLAMRQASKRAVMEHIRGGTQTKRKLSAGMVLALALLLAAIGALAAVLLGGKDFVTEIMQPKAMENDSDSWTQEEVQELLAQAAAHGLELDAAAQQRLLEGSGYFKEEMMRLFAKEELGYYPSTWSIENQYWYDQLLVESGLNEGPSRFLPEAGEATQAQVLDAVEQRIRGQYQPDAPLEDSAVYRRHMTHQWVSSPEAERVKGWYVRYEPLDVTRTDYAFTLDTEAGILEEWVTPGLLSGETGPPELRTLRSRFEEVYGGYATWAPETWVDYRAALLASGAAHGWAGQEVLRLLSLSEFAIPAEGTIPMEEAVDKAMAAAVAAGTDAANLLPAGAYATCLMDGDTLVWKVVLPGKAEGNTLVEIDAATGAARNVALAPFGSSAARYHMLESAYLANAEEKQEAGTLRFENRLYSAVAPMADGGFLLMGRMLEYGEDELLYRKACATRVGPGGETLWETLLETGTDFQEGVALEDGSFLLAYGIGGFGSDDLTVVTLDAKGQVLGEPVPLGLDGWVDKGNGCLIVEKYPEGEGSQPKTYIAVDGRGETLWTRTYDELQGGYKSLPSKDGGYWVAGTYSKDQQLETKYVFAGKLDEDGDVMWVGQAKDQLGAGMNDACETPDGGLLAVGNHSLRREDDGTEYGRSLNFAVRFSPEGEVEWFRDVPQPDIDTNGGSLLFERILPTAEGGALILANVPSTRGCYLYELDGEGEIIRRWQPEMEERALGQMQFFDAGEQAWVLYDYQERGAERYVPVVSYLTPAE